MLTRFYKNIHLCCIFLGLLSKWSSRIVLNRFMKIKFYSRHLLNVWVTLFWSLTKNLILYSFSWRTYNNSRFFNWTWILRGKRDLNVCMHLQDQLIFNQDSQPEISIYFLNQLYIRKNVVSCIEQVLAAKPHKTAAVRPPITRQKNYQSYTNQTCGTLLEKYRRTHKRHTPVDPFTWTSKGRMTR